MSNVTSAIKEQADHAREEWNEMTGNQKAARKARDDRNAERLKQGKPTIDTIPGEGNEN